MSAHWDFAMSINISQVHSQPPRIRLQGHYERLLGPRLSELPPERQWRLGTIQTSIGRRASKEATSSGPGMVDPWASCSR